VGGAGWVAVVGLWPPNSIGICDVHVVACPVAGGTSPAGAGVVDVVSVGGGQLRVSTLVCGPLPVDQVTEETCPTAVQGP
jgi:hypothetical protein